MNSKRIAIGFIGFAFVSCIVFLCRTYSSASTVVEMTLKEMCSESSDILIARVTSVQSYLHQEQNRIFTDIQLEADEVFKGPFQKLGKVVLTMYGGTVNGTTTIVVGAPQFNIDQRSLLFLFETQAPQPRRDLAVIGLSQGKFDIFVDQASAEEKVIRDQINFSLQLEKNGQRLSVTNTQALPLRDLVNHIKTYAASK